jgi:hypothetical protein
MDDHSPNEKVSGRRRHDGQTSPVAPLGTWVNSLWIPWALSFFVIQWSPRLVVIIASVSAKGNQAGSIKGGSKHLDNNSTRP